MLVYQHSLKLLSMAGDRCFELLSGCLFFFCSSISLDLSFSASVDFTPFICLWGEGEAEEDELEEEDDEERCGGVGSLGGALVLWSRSRSLSFSFSRCLSRSRFLLLSCSLSLSLSLDSERLLRRRTGEGERRDLGAGWENLCNNRNYSILL